MAQWCASRAQARELKNERGRCDLRRSAFAGDSGVSASHVLCIIPKDARDE